MPYPRNVYKKKKRSRKYSRKYANRSRSRRYKITKAPLPNYMMVKMRYQTNIVLDHGIAGIAVHVFSANGLYDPDITGTGHQPRGYDQLMTMYDHYVVMGSKITAAFASRSSAANTNANIGIALKDSYGTVSDANEYMEGRNQIFKAIEQINPSGCPKLTKTFSAKRFFGRTNVKDNQEFQGTINDNPAEQAYYHVWMQAFNSTVDVNPLDVNVFIDFIVLLREPKQPAQS